MIELTMSKKEGINLKPAREEAILYAFSIGLPEEEVDAWFDHYDANGWKVGRHAMKSWEAAMRNWKRNWSSGIYRNNNGNGKATQLPQTSSALLFTLTKRKEVAETEMKRLRAAHCFEGTWNNQWDDESARKRHRELRLLVQDIERRILELGD